MGVTANLANTGFTVETNNDSIVIKRVLDSKVGGTTLDVTGFAPLVVPAGHVLIIETSTGNFKPMPVSGSAYSTLPGGHTYGGIAINSAPTSKPFVGVLTIGTVNHNAMAYTVTTILTALKAALPLIDFRAD